MLQRSRQHSAVLKGDAVARQIEDVGFAFAGFQHALDGVQPPLLAGPRISTVDIPGHYGISHLSDPANL